ncbi:MAG: DUF357 domain-containing protein [Methanocalculaceae archaeon]|jgi:hypothetical protein|nr:DUF357 domain-containing protein [Methanocalculaceae archaeon]
MLIEAYGMQLEMETRAASPVVSAGTALGVTAADILAMVSCYASDGMGFYYKGDLVNAAASLAYGCGWLDAGISLGYIGGRTVSPLPVMADEIPASLQDHLMEKTHRYQWMLSEALASVVALPDPEIPLRHAAQNIGAAAVAGLTEGTTYLDVGDLVNALSFFSYGYGWLDCGVRAGLFGIIGDRHLFSI